MKVSLITTCYNRKDSVAETIESVLAQDYHDVEYIVVDGASTDGSVDIINSYRDRIDHIVSEPDSGMYEALNKGLRLATGDIVGWVHSDDVLYDRHVISKVVETLTLSGADFFYADGIYVDGTSGKTRRNWIGGAFHRWKLKAGWLPLHTTCYVRRSAVERLGVYDEQYKIAADTDFLLRYLGDKSLKVVYHKGYVVRMRTGGLSTDSSRRKLMWHEDVQIYRRHGFCGVPLKIMKMMWKVPMVLSAFFKK